MSYRGIRFNGNHSYEDLGFTLTSAPKIEFPKKIKHLVRIPYTNEVYDRSLATGFQEYEERRITCEFNVINKRSMDIVTTEELAVELAQWLDSSIGLQRLELDTVPFWYFMAEVSEILDWETNYFEYGTIKIVFRAYPYRIGVSYEGSPFWDDLTIFDYDQTVSFTLPPFNGNLKPIEVGDVVTIGGWVDSGVNTTSVNNDYITERYRIVEEVLEGGNKYRLEGNLIIDHADILQARTEVVPVTLHNLSSHSIKPAIETTANRGITIVRDGEIYNISGGLNNKFALNVGENNLLLYGQDCNVNFAWRKEVL